MSWSKSCCYFDQCNAAENCEQFLDKLVAESEKLAKTELNKLRRGKVKPLVSYDHPSQSVLCAGELEGRLVAWYCATGMDSPGGITSPQVIILTLNLFH